MDRELNREAVSSALAARGLTQTAVAEALGVTRAAVSKWLTGKAFPRPPELLRLGKLLGLAYAELVESVATEVNEPLVAYRKRARTKTTPEHLGRARDMGRLLAPMVPYLGFDPFLAAPRLKRPSRDYDYLQRLVAELRRDLKLDPAGPVKFEDLIGKFRELQAVIVPVMWGRQENHGNALHIHLPESKTTWIYLNLDSHLHDFKFWMAHELGHVLAVDLLTRGELDASEDFSDAFAGALLFPEPAAARAYAKHQRTPSASGRLQAIMAAAKEYTISPYSVYKEMERYAKARQSGRQLEALDQSYLHAAIAKFNQQFPTVSELLFDGAKPTADRYMRRSEEVFGTPLFKALGEYLKASPQGDSLLSRILDVPLVDARELRHALAQ